MEIYPEFPLVHPFVLAQMHKSAQKQRDDEVNHIWGIIDCLSALISLHMGEKELGSIFYESAEKRLDSIAFLCIESFIIRSILVKSLHCPLADSPANRPRLLLAFVVIS